MTAFLLDVFCGDTIPLQALVKRNGSAVNLTGATFRLTCRQWRHSAAIITKNTAQVDTPLSGIAIITIDPEDTEDFTDNIELNCDIELTEANGKRTTVADGILRFKLDLSR